jgi:hypothetical protein
MGPYLACLGNIAFGITDVFRKRSKHAALAGSVYDTRELVIVIIIIIIIIIIMNIITIISATIISATIIIIIIIIIITAIVNIIPPFPLPPSVSLHLFCIINSIVAEITAMKSKISLLACSFHHA